MKLLVQSLTVYLLVNCPTKPASRTRWGNSTRGKKERKPYTVPEDGSPVVISTRKKDIKDGEAPTKPAHPSQTSLLIKYFEGTKNINGETKRLSVRVKVTPSSGGRSVTSPCYTTDPISERLPSYTRRVLLFPRSSNVETVEQESSPSEANDIKPKASVTTPALQHGRQILYYAQAKYAYQAVIPEESSFQKGNMLAIVAHLADGWCEAIREGGDGVATGLVPSKYLENCENSAAGDQEGTAGEHYGSSNVVSSIAEYSFLDAESRD